MYERFYDLRERPFALSPDPDYLYRSRVHTEALSYLRYGIEGHAGFIVITGEIGSGKTTLLQSAMRSVDKHTAVARVVNTQLDARDLIEAVMLDFGLMPDAGMSKPRLLRVLAEYLVQQRMAGRLALLVIDEAQNLSRSALEEIRMLSNLETEKSKLIQIVLVGQPELRAVMSRPELEQLRQRVTVSYHLPALDVDETAAYINHRLARASNGTPIAFTRDVTDLVHQYSRGVPRRINVIADAILLYGYGEGQRVIDLGLSGKAIEELQTSGILAPEAPAAVANESTPGAPGISPASPTSAASETIAAPAQPLDDRAPAAAAVVPVADALRDLLARQERLIVTLQHMLTEQNHALQLHREQMAEMLKNAQRRPTSPPSPATAAPPATPAAEKHGSAATASRTAPSGPLAREMAPSRPWPPTDWPGPSSSERLLVPAMPPAAKEGWWGRLGRNVVSTFSLALKD